jgi:hypothetical protein
MLSVLGQNKWPAEAEEIARFWKLAYLSSLSAGWVNFISTTGRRHNLFFVN